jgi:RecA/RadA recombinase
MTAATERPTPDEIVKNLKKQFPSLRVYKASDEAAQLQVQQFGIPQLDEMCVGMLCGGFTVIWGPDKGGKSTLMARAIAQMQRDGRRVLLADLEGRFDPRWAALQGIDLDNLWLVQAGEEMLDFINEVLRKDAVDGIAVDSITARAARGEIQDKTGKSKSVAQDTIALIPKKLSQWYRIASALTMRQRVPVVLLSQVRMNIGAVAFADKTGGKSTAHWGSTELKITRQSKIEASKQGVKRQIGFWMRAELKKTSLCGNENQQVLLPFYFGIGIDDIAVAVRAGIDKGVIERGATNRVEFLDNSYASENQLVEKARENPKLADALIKAVADDVDEDDADETVYQEPEEETVVEPDPAGPEASNDATYTCKFCDAAPFDTPRGLKIHLGRKHKDKI